ncbi:FadR/GntR family transcriptional regulator [Roseomonas elaeocarpi]|uniref:FadR/GntR family transcriptional regulator n=1 Tax=Roseomonas elaeocarpi TaxID=907779 RepID=A0ABV6JSJ2_9PROT
MAITRPEASEQGGFDKVFLFLREQLLSGAISPGERLLGERELCLRVGVSRPTLREALRALAMLGVVEIRQGAGTVVRRPDASILGDFFAFAASQHGALVEDVMQARIAIECQAIRLACARATLADFDRLRAALEDVVATIADPDAGGLADHRFHQAIVDAAASDTLGTLYAAITPLLLRSHRHRRETMTEVEDGRAYLISHHRLIFDALAAGDPRRADEVLREHFAIGDDYRRRGRSGQHSQQDAKA